MYNVPDACTSEHEPTTKLAKSLRQCAWYSSAYADVGCNYMLCYPRVNALWTHPQLRGITRQHWSRGGGGCVAKRASHSGADRELSSALARGSGPNREVPLAVAQDSSRCGASRPIGNRARPVCAGGRHRMFGAVATWGYCTCMRTCVHDDGDGPLCARCSVGVGCVAG
jgi:hypothetical protein